MQRLFTHISMFRFRKMGLDMFLKRLFRQFGWDSQYLDPRKK